MYSIIGRVNSPSITSVSDTVDNPLYLTWSGSPIVSAYHYNYPL